MADSSCTLPRLLWFVALWGLSVTVLAMTAFAIRWVLI